MSSYSSPDYVTPNNALANGEIDLNAFQHRIYLQSEIDNYGYEIENIGNTFIIPLNLYSDKVKSVDELKDGDTVAIPDDVTNGGRALKVLEAAGLIKLKDSAEFNPTIDDIETYNTKITIEELKANVIPSTLADVTAAVVNGNYALDFGLKTEDAIYKDDQLDIEEYWNLIAARSADLEDADKLETYKKVVAAFQSDENRGSIQRPVRRLLHQGRLGSGSAGRQVTHSDSQCRRKAPAAFNLSNAVLYRIGFSRVSAHLIEFVKQIHKNGEHVSPFLYFKREKVSV